MGEKETDARKKTAYDRLEERQVAQFEDTPLISAIAENVTQRLPTVYFDDVRELYYAAEVMREPVFYILNSTATQFGQPVGDPYNTWFFTHAGVCYRYREKSTEDGVFER